MIGKVIDSLEKTIRPDWDRLTKLIATHPGGAMEHLLKMSKDLQKAKEEEPNLTLGEDASDEEEEKARRFVEMEMARMALTEAVIRAGRLKLEQAAVLKDLKELSPSAEVEADAGDHSFTDSIRTLLSHTVSDSIRTLLSHTEDNDA